MVAPGGLVWPQHRDFSRRNIPAFRKVRVLRPQSGAPRVSGAMEIRVSNEKIGRLLFDVARPNHEVGVTGGKSDHRRSSHQVLVDVIAHNGGASGKRHAVAIWGKRSIGVTHAADSKWLVVRASGAAAQQQDREAGSRNS